jgi:hypothetical protein
LRVVLLALGVILAALAFFLRWRRLQRLRATVAESHAAAETHGETLPASGSTPALDSKEALPIQLRFATLADRPSISMDLLRVFLILLAFLVVLAWVLLILPQGAVDRIALSLQPRDMPPPPQEKIALLYLGDEVKDKEFHIRGVVQNISVEPIEKLDATLRLYGLDGALLETALVRMDFEMIAPNATAQFHLTYPNYNAQFGSYSVDFKLRQGDPVLYKDMRETRART